MKFGGRQSCGNLTYQNDFGGAPRNYITSNTQPIMPTAGIYQQNGLGRDTYISLNNGGNYVMHHPDLQPLKGTFGDVKTHGVAINYYQQLPSKNVQYHKDGTGRDSYISSTNGGFYPSLPVAAYQQTFVNKLRTYQKNDQYLSNKKGMYLAKGLTIKQNLFQTIPTKKLQEIKHRLKSYNPNKTESQFDQRKQSKTNKLVSRMLSENQKESGISIEAGALDHSQQNPISYIFPTGSKSSAQLKRSLQHEAPKKSPFDVDFNSGRPVTHHSKVKSLINDNFSAGKSQSLVRLSKASPTRISMRPDSQIAGYQDGLDHRLSQPKRTNTPFVGINVLPTHSKQPSVFEFSNKAQTLTNFSRNTTNAKTSDHNEGEKPTAFGGAPDGQMTKTLTDYWNTKQETSDVKNKFQKKNLAMITMIKNRAQTANQNTRKKIQTPQVESGEQIEVFKGQHPNTTHKSAILIKRGAGASQTIQALKNHRLNRQKSECGERDKSPSQFNKRTKETETENNPAVFRKLQIKSQLNLKNSD